VFKELIELIIRMHLLAESIGEKTSEKKIKKILNETAKTVLETIVRFYNKAILLDRTVLDSLNFDYNKLDEALDYVENLISKEKDLYLLFDEQKFIEESPEDIKETLAAIYFSFKIFYMQFRDYMELFSKQMKNVIKQENEMENVIKQENEMKNNKRKEKFKVFRKHKEILPN
jgi:hypothetical protein